MTTGEKLVEMSTLETGTAMEHLLNISAIDIIYISQVLITDCTSPGSSDGALEISAEGGSGLYDYSIDGVYYQVSNIFTGLPAGDYTVYVRDSNDFENTATFDVKIHEPIFILTQNYAFIS